MIRLTGPYLPIIAPCSRHSLWPEPCQQFILLRLVFHGRQLFHGRQQGFVANFGQRLEGSKWTDGWMREAVHDSLRDGEYPDQGDRAQGHEQRQHASATYLGTAH